MVKTCSKCGKGFIPKTSSQIYCGVNRCEKRKQYPRKKVVKELNGDDKDFEKDKNNLINVTKRRLKTQYNLTIEQYQQMLATQENRCAICGSIDSKLVVDHSHTTGKVRGLLCNGCNSGIGFMKDSPSVMARAI